MKQIRFLFRGLLAGCFALSMVTTLSAQSSQEGIVKVVSLKGAARYTVSGDSNWKPVKVGLVLKPGSVIWTAGDSYVDVVLNNARATEGLGSAMGTDVTEVTTPDSGYRPKAVQDAIRIFENTVLGVDKLTVTKTGADTSSETQLDLKAGRIFGTVKKLSATSVYEIKIPNGVAGIRGTIYLLGSDGVLSVLTGSVVISYVSNGVPVVKEVPQGFQFDPKTGLVTEITNPVLRELARLAQIFANYLPNMRGTTFIRDNTIYNVSPIQSGGSGDSEQQN
jgi:hypothetical protein